MRDIVFYDGECGLCNRLNQFILNRDRHNRFCFASLQSELAKRELERFGCNAGDLNTVYVIANYESSSERLLSRMEAVIHILTTLGGFWRVAAILSWLPQALLNHAYNFVATRRHRWFGGSAACRLLSAEERSKFLGE